MAITMLILQILTILPTFVYLMNIGSQIPASKATKSAEVVQYNHSSFESLIAACLFFV